MSVQSGYPVYSLVVSYLQNRPHNSHTSKQSYAQANRLKCKYVKNTSPAPAAESLLWSWTGHVFKQPLPKSLWEQCNPFSHPLCHPVFSGLTVSRKVQTEKTGEVYLCNSERQILSRYKTPSLSLSLSYICQEHPSWVIPSTDVMVPSANSPISSSSFLPPSCHSQPRASHQTWEERVVIDKKKWRIEGRNGSSRLG